MRFLVVLTSVGSQQDQLVAEIASITGKEPVECQRLIAALPAVIQICTSEAEAHGIRERLVAVGAEATVATAAETEATSAHRRTGTFASMQDQPVNGERQKQPFGLRARYSTLQQKRKIQLWLAAGLVVVVVILLGAFFVLTRPGAGGGPAYNITEWPTARRVCEEAATKAYYLHWQSINPSFPYSLRPYIFFPERAQKLIYEEEYRYFVSEIKEILQDSKIDFHPEGPKTLIIRSWLLVFPLHSNFTLRSPFALEYTCIVRWRIEDLWLMERLDMLGRTWRY